jgi:hypothetical protein
MDRYLFEAELERRFEARVADDYDTSLIDHDRLAETERLDRSGDRIYTEVIDTGVVVVRADATDGT